MPTRTVKTDHDRALLDRLLDTQERPFTITITKGAKRSVAQNRLQRMWCNEISQQLGDQTPEEVRGYCKLTLGVPILRAENEAFRQRYDEIVKPLAYEQKMALMMEPLDFPTTRLMTSKQKARYLDDVYRHFAEKGLVLTDPETYGVAA